MKINQPSGDVDVVSALLDVKDVAASLRCSPRHVYRLCDRGGMPRPLKIGGLNRWDSRQIYDWITGGCRPIR